MKNEVIQPAGSLRGTLEIPGDKSISHRSLIFGALARGQSIIKNLLLSEDVRATLRILTQLGAQMEPGEDEFYKGGELKVEGRGIESFKPPREILDCGNSGTTMRLMLGLLSACPFESVLTGDTSLNRRPMERVIEPLTKMGAEFHLEQKGDKRFIHVKGFSKLRGIHHSLPLASAQVKSALLLAGLYAEGETVIEGPSASRDHTERLLKSMGAKIKVSEGKISLTPSKNLKPFQMMVPGDFSSAAFFIVAGLIIQGSEITLKNVGINPTRIGLYEILVKMGALIKFKKERIISGEPVADLLIKSSNLSVADISGTLIPRLIDEIPIFAVAAARAAGTSTVSDAAELRVKESDRIATICSEMKKLGVTLAEKPDGFSVGGPALFQSGEFDSHGDHRIAMSLAVAALSCQRESVIRDVDCVATSFPGFFGMLEKMVVKK